VDRHVALPSEEVREAHFGRNRTLLGSLLCLCLSCGAQADVLEDPSRGSIATERLDHEELRAFFHEPERLFSIIDLKGGSEGSIRIRPGRIVLKWRVNMDSGYGLVGNKVCARAIEGATEGDFHCFALYRPTSLFSSCTLYIVLIQERALGCLRQVSIVEPG